MNFDGSVLRIVWFSFDHCSGYAPSMSIRFDDAEYIKRSTKRQVENHFTICFLFFFLDKFAIILADLFDSCREEVDCREAMELKVIIRMKKERAEFEAQILAEENAPPKKANAEEEKKSKKKKSEKTAKRGPEPPIVTERTVVDMLPVFLKQEQEEHEARLMKLHPMNLKRRAVDLNQRQHIVLGGTYTLHYLERPVQSRKFQNHLFQRTCKYWRL